MKNTVIAIINTFDNKPKEKFKKLLEVFQNNDTAAPAQKRYFNASGFTKVNLESLEYEIKKLYSITDKALRLALIDVDVEKVVAKTLSEEMQSAVNAIDLDNADYHKALIPLSNSISEALDIELESRKKDALIAFIKSYKVEAKSTQSTNTDNPFTDAPEEVKESVKLREEFPFLAQDDCPDKLKILVADKFTAFYKYVGASEALMQLRDSEDCEAIFDLAKKAVVNFELNLEIYDELNYFKAHGEILGEHPIFEDEMLAKKVADTKEVDLAKRKKNLEIYIARDEKKLDKIKDDSKKQKALDKINTWKQELVLIEKRIETIQSK